MRGGAVDAEEHLLDMRRVQVDAADDQHVVVPPAQPVRRTVVRPHAHGSIADRAEVAGAVANQRQRLLGQRGEHELALGPGRDAGAVAGSITSTRK